jgi:hypothetical protein
MKKRIRVSQLMARVKAGGKALDNLPVTSPLRVQDLDGRPPGASVMDEQKLLPSSLPEKRYQCSPIIGSVNKLTFAYKGLCSSKLVGLRQSFVRNMLSILLSLNVKISSLSFESWV